MKAKERQHLARVAEIGCIVCYNNGHPGTPAEIHHIRFGVGLGQRSNNYLTIPLCHIHHRTGGHGVAFHAGKRTFEQNFGTEEQLLTQVEQMIDGI